MNKPYKHPKPPPLDKALIALTALCITMCIIWAALSFARAQPVAQPDKPAPVIKAVIPVASVVSAHDDGAGGADMPVVALPVVEAVEAEVGPEEPEPDKPYTEQDIVMLSKMVYGEARGCKAEEQALCVWTALNRLESGRFGDTIEYIVAAPRQFVGYKAKHPVTDEIRAVVEEALEAWANGEEAPVCPPYAKKSGYLYFSGDGRHNWFR